MFLLLRLRYRLTEADAPESLAEELLVSGYSPNGKVNALMDPDDALRLMGSATADANITPEERHRSVQDALDLVPSLTQLLERLARDRAERLRQAHRRVRHITRERKLDVQPHLPVDILGIYVLVPIPKGAAREA